jgi:hypothetical protein
MVSLVRLVSYDGRTEPRTEVFVSDGRLQEQWVTNLKTVLGFNFDEDVRLRNNNFFLCYSTIRIE